MQSMTYGVLPTEEEFTEAYNDSELIDGMFHFGNDQRLGNCELNCTELWKEVCKAHSEYVQGTGCLRTEDSETAGDWCSLVLSCLGFEWI